jgi:hypothetical protein
VINQALSPSPLIPNDMPVARRFLDYSGAWVALLRAVRLAACCFLRLVLRFNMRNSWRLLPVDLPLTKSFSRLIILRLNAFQFPGRKWASGPVGQCASHGY